MITFKPILSRTNCIVYALVFTAGFFKITLSWGGTQSIYIATLLCKREISSKKKKVTRCVLNMP